MVNGPSHSLPSAPPSPSHPASSPASDVGPECPPPPSERFLLVDLNAVAHNVARLRDAVAPAGLIAVVKADAYGHGAVPVARTVLAAGAQMLGVAHVREGLQLRAAGIEAPVLAWLHTRFTDFDAAVVHGIQLGVSGWDLEAAAEAAGRTGIPAVVHLKIDTGLGRNGATSRDWPELVAQAAALQTEGLVRVEGIFTHLAVADEPERPETAQQAAAFAQAVETARAAGLEPHLLHLANSPAALAGLLPGTERRAWTADAVRVGLALYGLSPFPGISSEQLGLRPAMTAQTFVSAVKEVEAGQGVSYGLNYITSGPTTLALVPVGYADGVPRVGTGGPVRIHPAGAPAATYPVVGRVAMDQMVVDLGRPGLSDPALGYLHAPAVLFGAGENPPVEAWAEAAGTINYEIVTRMSARMDRIHRGGPGAEGSEPQDITEPEDIAEAGDITEPEDITEPDDIAEPGDATGSAGQAASPKEFLTDLPTEEATAALAEDLADLLRAGDLVVMTGELGAGKTTFVRALGRALGVGGNVISPTFVLARIHRHDPQGPRPDGPDLVHVDAYRLSSPEEVDDLDLEHTMDDSVTVVEWGRGLVEHLADSRVEIDLERSRGAGAPVVEGSEEDTDPRRARLRFIGPRWAGAEPGARLRAAH